MVLAAAIPWPGLASDNPELAQDGSPDRVVLVVADALGHQVDLLREAFLLPPRRHRAVVSLDLQRPEHQKPHGARVMQPATTGKGPTAPPRTARQPCLQPSHHHTATTREHAVRSKDKRHTSEVLS